MRIPQLLVLAASLGICGAALCQAPRRVQFAFSGTTTASQLLIQDVMKSVMEVGDEELGCQKPDSVIAEVLPEGEQPADPPAAPEGAERAVHERWTVDFCGQELPFLLTFWRLEQGGTAFDLDYPAAGNMAESGAAQTQLQ